LSSDAGALGRPFDRFLWVLAVIAAGILALIAVVICVNVVLRNLGMSSIYGALDAIQYALMVATFLGAPHVLARGGHVKVDLITNAVPDGARRALDVAVSLIGGASAAVLGWYGAEAAWASAARGSMIRTSFVIPEWWMLIFVPLSMALCVIVFARRLLHPEAQEQRTASGL
jgi:TRAP-type C4-dicarboxylate transport system permease small subunit